jgi:hypothetical protein
MKICAKVASEIFFPLTICMLELKFIQKHYDKMNEVGQITKMWMLTTQTLFFHTCHGKC